MIVCVDFPGSPDATSLTEAAVIHFVRTGIGFDPGAFQSLDVVNAVDEKAAHVIYSDPGDNPQFELQIEVHVVSGATGPVVVKPGPWP